MSKPLRFLVVDDEPDVEMLFRQKFRKELKSGLLELAFALSGIDALEILRCNDPPDVVYIFSDINMPGMSGLELLERVTDEFPQIKVSMISAYGDQENYNRAMESGARGFFTKPIDFVTLKEEITSLLIDRKNI